MKHTLSLSGVFAMLMVWGLNSGCESTYKEAPKKNHGHTTEAHMEDAAWLEGKWVATLGESVFYETWNQDEKHGLSGTGYAISGTDTVSSEMFHLKEHEHSLQYITTVMGQNGGKEVVFNLTKVSENNLTFENPEHDFPKVISYTKITNDSMVAVISGELDAMEFAFSRRK